MTNESTKLEKDIASAKRIEDKIELEQMFGDTIISLLRSPNGDLYVKIRRGMPAEKTYSIENFLMLTKKFDVIRQEIYQRKGGK